MRVMALFSTSFFAKYLLEDGPGRGHLCHTDTFLVYFCCGDKCKYPFFYSFAHISKGDFASGVYLSFKGCQVNFLVLFDF